MKLYPEDVVADFYCIPSHNHQAYYAMLSCTDDNYRLTYIKTQVYFPGHKNPIKMYRSCADGYAGGSPYDTYFSGRWFIS